MEDLPLVLYIISARKDIELEDIVEAAKTVSPERSKIIMSIAEQAWRREWRKESKKLPDRCLIKNLTWKLYPAVPAYPKKILKN